jgi:predicted RNA-binding protein associated with RNAse of E/G family
MPPPLYRQTRVDIDEYHGLVCFIQLSGGEFKYWDMPLAGKIAILGPGMSWLQLIPDGTSRVITAMYLPDDSVSIWYVDIIERVEYDPDGVAAFIDKYLDVIFTPQGDVSIDDRDELDAAFNSGELSEDQYRSALAECDRIINELCSDIKKTETVCGKILAYIKKCRPID